jgi:Protein of unknown function (DUF2778)
MSWVYNAANGTLSHNGQAAGTGYSGHPPYVNDPAAERLINQGPICAGLYAIGEAFDSPTKGPCVLPLTPSDDTPVYGRGGFLIHGDEVEHPGAELASDGCIIMPRNTRLLISLSSDKDLVVA